MLTRVGLRGLSFPRRINPRNNIPRTKESFAKIQTFLAFIFQPMLLTTFFVRAVLLFVRNFERVVNERREMFRWIR